jgi:hypothetical protein
MKVVRLSALRTNARQWYTIVFLEFNRTVYSIYNGIQETVYDSVETVYESVETVYESVVVI